MTRRTKSPMPRRMTRPGFTRRQVLRGLAGASVALPLLTTAASSRAQDARYPTRFIVFFHPNGVEAGAWFPTAGGSPAEFTLNRCHAPLVPWRDQLVVTRGIDMQVTRLGFGEPHQRGMGGVLTGRENNSGSMMGGDGSLSGWNLGTSVDQVIANRIGHGTRFRSLELGVRADAGSATGEVRNRIIYGAPELALPPVNDPVAIFNRLFTDTHSDTDALVALRAQRRSVLDAALGSLEELARAVPAAERAKLELHATLVRDLETRISSSMPTGACAAPDRPAFMATDSEETMPAISRMQIDLLVMALACDLTRVGSLQYSNAINHVRLPFVSYRNQAGAQVQSLGDGHGLSHDQGGSRFDVDEEWVARDTWYAGEVAYLLERLAAVPEGDGTLLDHSVILWINELAHGATHSHVNMPFLVAGGGSGRIRTGQYLEFEHEPHNNLLLALLHAFGFDDASFGHPDFCTRPLPGLLV